MYEAYYYTRENGIMLRKDYQEDYHAHKGRCHRTDIYHFKNLNAVEKDMMSNDEIR